jgi:hypothetical protein
MHQTTKRDFVIIVVLLCPQPLNGLYDLMKVLLLKYLTSGLNMKYYSVSKDS